MADGEGGGSLGKGQERICYIKRRANVGRSGRHPGVIIAVDHYCRKSEIIYSNKWT